MIIYAKYINYRGYRMRYTITLVSVFLLFALMMGCDEAGNDGGDTTGSVTGELTFGESGSEVDSSLDYYVSVMTSAQYSAWLSGGGGDPSDDETAGIQGAFTSTPTDNTTAYTVSSVPAGTYYVFAWAWVTADPATQSPDYASYEHVETTGPGGLAGGGTLFVNLTVSTPAGDPPAAP
jgi:hypothetical protein